MWKVVEGESVCGRGLKVECMRKGVKVKMYVEGGGRSKCMRKGVEGQSVCGREVEGALKVGWGRGGRVG